MTETDISGLEKLEAEQCCERCKGPMTHLWGHLLLEFWNIPAEHERSVLDVVEGLEKRALCWHCFVELLSTIQQFFRVSTKAGAPSCPPSTSPGPVKSS